MGDELYFAEAHRRYGSNPAFARVDIPLAKLEKMTQRELAFLEEEIREALIEKLATIVDRDLVMRGTLTISDIDPKVTTPSTSYVGAVRRWRLTEGA
jgi:hypothetical protein